MENVIKVYGSVEFRDAVLDLANKGHNVYVKMADFGRPAYRVIARIDAFDKITLDDLFASDWPPVYMEDFAQALIRAKEEDKKVGVEVFTL